MSRKWRFDPKWRIKIRFFHVTLRVSNIFLIFFLHSLGLSRRTFCGKKVFQKIQDGGFNDFFHSSRHLGTSNPKFTLRSYMENRVMCERGHFFRSRGDGVKLNTIPGTPRLYSVRSIHMQNLCFSCFP
jgi:hypothetical protein